MQSTSGSLRLALVLTAAVAVLELAGGFAARSLALLADSAHVFMDVLALGIAMAAGAQALRPATARQTFGFARFEILAALANGGLLFAVTILIVVEAIRRFSAPQLPQGKLMFAVAAVGAIVNIGLGFSLARGASRNLNVKAALFHVASDAIGAVAVMVGGIFVITLRLAWIDPLLSLIVAAIIVIGVIRIVREATDVLLESTPAHAGLKAVRERIGAIPGVVEVHDLHVWTIGPANHALSVHVLLPDGRISEATQVLRTINDALRAEFGITHVTVQFECVSCAENERVVCTQALS